LVCTGILSVLFSLSPLIIQSIPLAFILIVLIGFSNSIYVIAVMSAIQMYVDDKFRARIVGVFVLSFSFMSLGSLWVGFLGGLIDSVFSVEKVGVLVALSFGGFVLFTVGILVYLFSDSVKKIS
jgi:MFS family permease